MPDDYGRRPDGSLKGEGFFGALQRPRGGVSSELSIGVDFGRGEMDIPTMVPTLTPREMQTLLRLDNDQPIPSAIVDKAVAYARQRLAAGLPVFAGPGEARPHLLPQSPTLPSPPIPPSPSMIGLADLVRLVQRPRGGTR